MVMVDFKKYDSVSLLNYQEDKYIDFNLYTKYWYGLFVEHLIKRDQEHRSDYDNYKIMFQSMKKRTTTILLK